MSENDYRLTLRSPSSPCGGILPTMACALGVRVAFAHFFGNSSVIFAHLFGLFGVVFAHFFGVALALAAIM